MATVCYTDPNAGVLVVAPLNNPAAAGEAIPAAQAKPIVTSIPSNTIPNAIAFSFTPLSRRDAKKLGPSCSPMVNTKRMSPNSCTKFKIARSIWTPKWPATSPAKGPSDYPNRHPSLSMLQSPNRKPPQWIKPPPPKRSGGFRKWALGNSNRITYSLLAHASKVGPHPSRFRQAVAEAL